MKSAGLSISLFLALLVQTCQAIEFKAADAYVLPEGKTATNELWLQARTITFGGTAGDDCFLLADSVNQISTSNIPTLRLPGAFHADVWAAGETVELTGPVAAHARLAAMKTLLLAGPVGKNLIALSPTITLATNAVIRGSALLIGQDIIINGTISGNTRIYSSSVTLAGRFEGDLMINSGDITVMPGTYIGGNLIYHMDHDLVLDSRVALGGKMIKQDLIQKAQEPMTSGYLLLQLALLCAAAMVGLAFVSLMPGIVAMSVHKLSESPWRCVLFGFVAISLVPTASFFLLFTLVGIPLSILLMLAYLILMYVAKIVVGLYIGHLILRRKTPIPANLLFPIMSLGLLVLYSAASLPFPIGITCWFAITLAGMGALVAAMLDRRIPVMVSYPPDGQGNPPPLPGNFPPGAV